MKILVPVKRVIDYEAKIKVKADGSGVETDGIKFIVNPFDEIAVEEALKIKEAGHATEVVVVGIGGEDSKQQLIYAMAMGADSAILVKHDDFVDSDLAARAIAELYKKGDYRVIIMGKQAIDSDASQTPQLIAAYLDLPNASFASEITVEGQDFKVVREVDGGLEQVKVTLPAVISTDLRLNKPRYAPLPGIMKAKKKPLDEFSLADLGLDATTKIKLNKFYPPEERKAGRKVSDINELIDALKNEAKVL